MWSPRPDEWRPINHSCEPSAWLDGLDVVARHDLLPDDEITLDYAIFCAEPMREFACECGALRCRKVIRGSDHLGDFVDRYGDHVSDYVRSRRRAREAAEAAQIAEVAEPMPAEVRSRRSRSRRRA